jgi:hypothetical protein
LSSESSSEDNSKGAFLVISFNCDTLLDVIVIGIKDVLSLELLSLLVEFEDKVHFLAVSLSQMQFTSKVL